MIARVVLAVVLAVVLLIAVAVVLYVVWTLVIAAAYSARHQRREFDQDLSKACGYEAGDVRLAAELRALPAPGKDYISDRDVVLPFTPPPERTWEQMTSHQLPLAYYPDDGLPELWAAQDRGEASFGDDPARFARQPAEPGPPIVADITDADRPARVPPSCSCGSYGHWQRDHDAAAAQVVTFRPEPGTTPEAADSTFVRALLALPLSRVYEAFEGARQ